MFEDQKIELLPEKTTMFSLNLGNMSFNNALAVAANVANINVAGSQANLASAAAAAGSNVG